MLRELEEMPYKEIAEVMGVPMGTVMSGLARGRAQLRDLLQRAGLKGQSAEERVRGVEERRELRK